MVRIFVKTFPFQKIEGKLERALVKFQSTLLDFNYSTVSSLPQVTWHLFPLTLKVLLLLYLQALLFLWYLIEVKRETESKEWKNCGEKEKMRDSNWHYIARRSSLKKTYFRAHSVPLLICTGAKKRRTSIFLFLNYNTSLNSKTLSLMAALNALCPLKWLVNH